MNYMTVPFFPPALHTRTELLSNPYASSIMNMSLGRSWSGVVKAAGLSRNDVSVK